MCYSVMQVCKIIALNIVAQSKTLYYRIPEIGVRVVRQGALPLLEKALHVKSGHAVKLVNKFKCNLLEVYLIGITL